MISMEYHKQQDVGLHENWFVVDKLFVFIVVIM